MNKKYPLRLLFDFLFLGEQEQAFFCLPEHRHKAWPAATGFTLTYSVCVLCLMALINGMTESCFSKIRKRKGKQKQIRKTAEQHLNHTSSAAQ